MPILNISGTGTSTVESLRLLTPAFYPAEISHKAARPALRSYTPYKPLLSLQEYKGKRVIEKVVDTPIGNLWLWVHLVYIQ